MSLNIAAEALNDITSIGSGIDWHRPLSSQSYYSERCCCCRRCSCSCCCCWRRNWQLWLQRHRCRMSSNRCRGLIFTVTVILCVVVVSHCVHVPSSSDSWVLLPIFSQKQQQHYYIMIQGTAVMRQDSLTAWLFIRVYASLYYKRSGVGNITAVLLQIYCWFG